MTFYHRRRHLDANKETFQKVLIQDVKTFPVPIPEVCGTEWNSWMSQIGEYVRRRQQLEERLQGEAEPAIQRQLMHDIRLCEDYLDGQVYQLYRVGESDKRIIESVV